MPSPADKLRELLARPGLLIMPGCHDAISAKLIETAGFDLAFMSGFAVSGSQLGLPDTGLVSYGEMVEQGRKICSAISIPVCGDGDTGYGNALNVKRTVQGYAAAGFACIMIEDQLAPKRCGHTRNKAVVSRDDAFNRIQAAVDSRNEGRDILIMARTDARATHGLDEAIARARGFAEIGADISFIEAPESEAEMRQYCDSVAGPKMANLIEFGKTPNLAPNQLEAIGYKIAVYPLTLLNASILAMQSCLEAIREGRQPPNILDFEGLKAAVGFPGYYEDESRYLSDR